MGIARESAPSILKFPNSRRKGVMCLGRAVPTAHRWSPDTTTSNARVRIDIARDDVTRWLDIRSFLTNLSEPYRSEAIESISLAGWNFNNLRYILNFRKFQLTPNMYVHVYACVLYGKVLLLKARLSLCDFSNRISTKIVAKFVREFLSRNICSICPGEIWTGLNLNQFKNNLHKFIWLIWRIYMDLTWPFYILLLRIYLWFRICIVFVSYVNVNVKLYTFYISFFSFYTLFAGTKKGLL